MKTKNIFNKIAQLATIMLFCANIATTWAAEPRIVINSVPLIGKNGYAEGRVIWDELTPDNVGQYAVIALLHATWPGGGGYYVKPDYSSYLNAIDATGNFFVRITTGGVDADADEVIFYFVERANFNGIGGEILNRPAMMTGKYLSTATIYRSSWAPPLTSNIPPGFVAAGTVITLSCREGGVIRYTLDGSDPITSPSVQTYGNNVFTVPEDGALLVKATVETSNLYSSVYSFVWLPKEPLITPFWGLNVSLALNGEYFGYPLTESTTRERILPLVPLTKWIRTFSTTGNGHEYINKIAKDAGLRTMTGLSITNDAANNNAQIEGLRQMLEEGPAPDLIAVGNETSLMGVSPATLASCIDAVREMVLEQDLIIPVGSVDIAGASRIPSVLEKLDFIGVNIYNGTWDNTPENQMFDAMKQTFEENVSEFSSRKLVLLTETGTPYSGGAYSFPGGTQTASKEKAANYLCGFLDWIKRDDIPSFYFEAYDEPVKSQGGGQIIEQYFGILDGNLEIHSFYQDCINHSLAGISPIKSTGNRTIFYPNPTTGKVFFNTESNIRFCDTRGLLLQEAFGNQVDLSAYPQGIYFLQVNGVWNKVVKK